MARKSLFCDTAHDLSVSSVRKNEVLATEENIKPSSEEWIGGLSHVIGLTDAKVEPSLRTVISSDVKNDKLALFLPPEMSELQPENLRYLQALASSQGCLLIEDRRTMKIQPIVENRDLKPHKLAQGINALLEQTGMQGDRLELSTPHRLNPENIQLDIVQLIDMAAYSIAQSKRVVLLPNDAMVEATGNETHPICAYACELRSAKLDTTLSFFDSPGFKAIGYITGNQFVTHVLVGGGPLRAPQLWSNHEAMSQNYFRFQLFRSTYPGQDFGLLYNTFYMDLNQLASHLTSHANQS